MLTPHRKFFCARLAALPTGAPAHLRQAHDAVNKVAVIEGRENASVAWDHYCKAQGRVFCGRDARIKLAMLTPEKPGVMGTNPRRGHMEWKRSL